MIHIKNSYIIFDFDATLGTLLIDWKEWHKGIGEIIHSYDSSFTLHLKGELVHGYVNGYVKKFGDPFLQKIISFVDEYEMQNAKGFEVNKNAREFIESNREKSFSIWSSNSRAIIEVMLKQNGLAGVFEPIACRDNVRYIKPEIDGFAIVHDLNVDKSDYVMIGDSRFDKGAAENVGIEYIDITQL